jgi:succinate dehydrogenase/fumarate reductase-like Fe-S protein
MTGRLLAWMPLLVLGTACPSTWGKEGYVQKTFHKNILRETLDHSACPLTDDQWVLRCGNAVDHSGSCPEKCPLANEVPKIEESEEEW